MPLSADLRKELQAVGALVEPCGSRVTWSGIPATDSDFDYLVEAKDVADVELFIEAEGYAIDGERYDDDDQRQFTSWRLGNTNLLVTDNHDWAAKHRMATALCKKLDLAKKADRIAIFQAILYSKVD